MTAGFDLAAKAYDATFTHSLIGKHQRTAVRDKLLKIINKNAASSVLELNCGTGEDAMWLSSLGLDVTATDISEGMLRVASTKPGLQKIKKADINDAHIIFKTTKFDLIFSNFGGINCLPPQNVAEFFKNIQGILNENGRLVLVVMPQSTLVEKLYFYLKGDHKSARRRNAPVLANVDGALIETHYYNPRKLSALANGFITERVDAIGFLVPPSYLEPIARKFPIALGLAATIDRILSRVRPLAKYSDHYLVSYKKQ